MGKKRTQIKTKPTKLLWSTRAFDFLCALKDSICAFFVSLFNLAYELLLRILTGVAHIIKLNKYYLDEHGLLGYLEHTFTQIGLWFYFIFIAILLSNYLINPGSFSLLFLLIFLFGFLYVLRLAEIPKDFVRNAFFAIIALLIIESSVQPLLTPKITTHTNLEKIVINEIYQLEYYTTRVNVQNPIISLSINQLQMLGLQDFNFLCSQIRFNESGRFVSQTSNIEDVRLYDRDDKRALVNICPSKSALEEREVDFEITSVRDVGWWHQNFSVCHKVQDVFVNDSYKDDRVVVRLSLVAKNDYSVPVYYGYDLINAYQCEGEEHPWSALSTFLTAQCEGETCQDVQEYEDLFNYSCVRFGYYDSNEGHTTYYWTNSLEEKRDLDFPFLELKFNSGHSTQQVDVEFFRAEKCSN